MKKITNKILIILLSVILLFNIIGVSIIISKYNNGSLDYWINSFFLHKYNNGQGEIHINQSENMMPPFEKE